jgi:elongation factor 3
MDAFVAKLSDKKGAEEGLKGLLDLVSKGGKLEVVDILDSMGTILELASDKQKPVASGACELANAVFEKAEYWSASALLRSIEKGLDQKAKPPTKELACDLILAFSKKAPKSLAREIEWIVQPIVHLVNDIKASVKSKAKACLEAMCYCCGNKDIIGSEPGAVVYAESFIPTIIKACESLKSVEECVEKLASCVFVQNVEAPHLSVITPVLWRGLNTKSEACQRRCCLIVDNMCKLVDDPREGQPLFHEIMPLVKKRADEISDPECREMAEKTVGTIEKLHGYGPKPELSVKDLAGKADAAATGKLTEKQLKYLQTVCYAMSRGNVFDLDSWKSVCAPMLSAAVAESLMNEMAKAGEKDEVEFIDDSTDPDLYKGSFSLAYGTLTLLRDTKLHLKKNKFYALLGPNNCGKTTLMRAISKEKVEGFPKRDELVTIFVEHEVEEREIAQEDGQYGPTKAWPLGKFNIDLNGMEFCVDTCNNVYSRQPPVKLEEAEAELGTIGFKNKAKGVNLKAAADMCNPITTYSGGWKVKMQLCCAKLINADILMLDEPTGHLDVKNIEWMKNWLNNFPGSIIASSSNSQFLDEMCTHIIDFQDRKLVQFKSTKGTVLTDFVKANPAKEAYFKLTNKNQKFIFPAPGILEGVKSRGRAILKMNMVSFKYPTHEKNTVQDICLSVCMASRIAVVGPNGAGKSTAIKLLIGELKNETGTIFRHSGMRLAYVAQHAFHHLEKHLDKTPTQYILWRFAGNDDRESLENQTKEINVDEEALRAVKWCVDSKTGTVRKVVVGEKGDIPVVPDCLLNRRKNKAKKYEYETKWMYKPIEASCWVERDTLVAMGYEKMVCREDEKQAAAAGLMSKPLTQPSVEKALKDFGLDNETATHSPIKGLSGGQKVKVVLAAAMWQNPHVLILDEPTNYLDRDGLGALSLGLAEYLGGVVIISHNMEFANSVCSQKWIMDAGRLREEGEIQLDEDEDLGAAQADQEEVTDASGNVIKVNKAKTMSDKDRKKAIKEIEKKLKDHKKKNTLSDAEKWELEDKLAELKTEMGG